MELDNPPIVKNEKEYIEMAVDFANAKDLSNIKKYYREKAKQKLFNTQNVGREFNQILLNLNY